VDYAGFSRQCSKLLCSELADLDELVKAHLDGLRVAGHQGWESCEEALGHMEPSTVFMAGVLAFGSRDMERIRQVLEAGCSDPVLERALISGSGMVIIRPGRGLHTGNRITGADASSLCGACPRRTPGGEIEIMELVNKTKVSIEWTLDFPTGWWRTSDNGFQGAFSVSADREDAVPFAAMSLPTVLKSACEIPLLCAVR
jgi:hypothetical protein